LVHFRNVDDFHDVLFFIFLVFDQNCIPETSLPDNVDLSIFLHWDFKVKPLILYYKISNSPTLISDAFYSKYLSNYISINLINKFMGFDLGILNWVNIGLIMYEEE
jgi:hypothetical protein